MSTLPELARKAAESYINDLAWDGLDATGRDEAAKPILRALEAAVATLKEELSAAKQDAEDNYLQGQKKGAIDAGQGSILRQRDAALAALAELAELAEERGAPVHLDLADALARLREALSAVNDPERVAFEWFADAHPREAFALNPANFIAYARRLAPHHSAADIVRLIKETE